MSSSKPFYITTPIYYVNDKPHIGHTYTTLLADVLSRYHRLLGDPTWFLTGTDEHGQKVEKAAKALNHSPLEHCNETVVHFQNLWKKLSISNDDFIRTTEKRHITIVQQILKKLFDQGEIYRKDYEGWYCVPCERFFNEGDLIDQTCPDCKRPVEKITESNYFFKMSAYQEWLIEYIESHPTFIQPDFRRNETLGFLKKPLGDLCISRPKTRLSWGIELPFDSDYVCYVWFDALINYISGVGYLSDDAKFSKWWPVNYQLIGKDILTTHTVYWPTMLKAMGVPMPQTIYAHGWWLIEGEKMSKSLGNVIDPLALCDEFGVDAFRYYTIAEMATGQDAVFSRGKFIERYNSDLANNVGNLCSRVIKMISANLDNVIPAQGELTPIDEKLKQVILQTIADVEGLILALKLDQAMDLVIASVKLCNQYLENTEPWKMKKDPALKERLKTVMYTVAESLRIITCLLHPVMPEKMAQVRTVLGLNEPVYSELRTWGILKEGLALQPVESLFPRIVMEK